VFGIRSQLRALAPSAVLIGSNKAVGLAFWLVVIAAFSVLEIVARSTRVPVPSFGELVARYLRHPAVRALGIALWLFAGWHLFSH
jgi:hypothetical protein